MATYQIEQILYQVKSFLFLSPCCVTFPWDVGQLPTHTQDTADDRPKKCFPEA